MIDKMAGYAFGSKPPFGLGADRRCPPAPRDDNMEQLKSWSAPRLTPRGVCAMIGTRDEAFMSGFKN
jgi:hypothetical protein